MKLAIILVIKFNLQKLRSNSHIMTFTHLKGAVAFSTFVLCILMGKIEGRMKKG